MCCKFSVSYKKKDPGARPTHMVTSIVSLIQEVSSIHVKKWVEFQSAFICQLKVKMYLYGLTLNIPVKILQNALFVR